MEANRTFKLPPIISDGMILQREKTTKLWGWDQPGQLIQVTLGETHFETVTSSAGEWAIELSPFSAGGPYVLRITGSQAREISDVYFGEVWLAGGQSNMELPLSRTLDLFATDLARIDNPYIREFRVPIEYDFSGPQKIGKEIGFWKKADQENIYTFSAAAYFFAEKLYETLQVPIGILMTAAGGTPVEAWMAKEDLEPSQALQEELVQLQHNDWIEAVKQEEMQRIHAWHQRLAEQEESHPIQEWQKIDFDDSNWQEFVVPNMFHDTNIAGTAGAIWFRKKFVVSAQEIIQEEALLKVGAIVDFDETFINGIQVGKTEYRYPPRRYPLPAGILQEGENILVVRVIINGTSGGFIPGKIYGIETQKGFIDLSGSWKYQRSAEAENSPALTFFQNKPTGLYNSMIHPIKEYSIAGFLYYQGESNTGAPDNYAEKLKKLIQRWRHDWETRDLPFLFVQLANYQDDMSTDLTHEGWAILREQQAQVERDVSQTALTVTIDVGEENDLHPQDKRTVGQRLADDALQLAYRYPAKQIKPKLEHVQLDSERIVCTFQDTLQMVRSRNKSSYLEVYIAEKGWKKVPGILEHNKLMIPLHHLGKVSGVRYAYRANPESPPYYGKDGYPVAPFIRLWKNEQIKTARRKR